VLNANFDKDEADFISKAGLGSDRGMSRGRDGAANGASNEVQIAAITVATNMAGRGTDIKPDEAAKRVGGLHVILTEMHGAQRIDRQFIGRAGRQGDPGSAQIFVALDDELVTQHTPGLIAALKARTAVGAGKGGELSETRVGIGIFRLAQSRSEARDRRNRAAVLKQDNWMEKYLPGM